MTKTNGATSSVPGGSVLYTIVATNAGPSAVTGVTVSDALPAVLTGATWTCVASVGSLCPATGTGNINTTVIAKNTVVDSSSKLRTSTVMSFFTMIHTMRKKALMRGPRQWRPDSARGGLARCPNRPRAGR